jgi:hypothetical protein
MSKVFWTGSTKSGCAGQYSDCFSDGIDDDDKFEETILPSDNGGSCVGFAMLGVDFISKSMPCDRKLFLGCQSLGRRNKQQKNRKDVYNLIFFQHLKKNLLHTLQCHGCEYDSAI